MAEKRIYTEEGILKQLKDHYKRNGKITKRSFEEDKTVCSEATVRNNFGSWDKAVRIAGLEKTHREIYSNEDLLKQLKTHYGKNSRILISSFDADEMTCSSGTIIQRFGSWKKGLVRAGLETDVCKYTKEEVLNQLKEHYERNGKITKKSFEEDKTVCSAVTVKRKFGSWGEALKIAGLEKTHREIYSDEEILGQLKAHYKKNSKITVQSFEIDKTVCSTSIILRRFGSWNKALERAGLKKNNYTRKDIIEQLQAHYKRNGKITRSSFSSDEMTCSTDTVANKLGSWQRALEELGYVKPREYIEYNKEKLFLLLEKKVKSGELRKRQDLNKIKGIPSDPYITNIWKWSELVELLKIEDTFINYTDEILIEKYKQMKKMEEYKNKKISANEYSRVTGVDPGTISGHFGSWNDFCIIVNNDGWNSTEITYTNEELLELYLKVSQKLGKEETGATARDLEDELGFSAGVFSIRFGGLNNLRKKLNMKERNEGTPRYTKEEIRKQLLKKYEEYERRLTPRELKEIHKKSTKENNWVFPGYTTILKYFQTTKMSEVWNEVLRNKDKR